MILETIHPNPVALRVAMDHWRGILERELERHTVIDWSREMSHPACLVICSRVLAEAHMEPYGEPERHHYQPGRHTLDWLLKRKQARQ